VRRNLIGDIYALRLIGFITLAFLIGVFVYSCVTGRGGKA